MTGDVGVLMEALKRQSPEAWQSYIATVRQEGMIEGGTYDTVLKTAFALFPGRGTQGIVDLLERMLDMVREELGMENGGNDGRVESNSLAYTAKAGGTALLDTIANYCRLKGTP